MGAILIVRTVLWAAAAAGLLSAPALAASLAGSSPGYHYFWKSGASIEAHDEAVIDCFVRLRAMQIGSDSLTGVADQEAVTGGVGGIIGGLLEGAENREGLTANLEGCMAIKGWSVVGLTPAEGKAIKGLKDAARMHEKLAPLIGLPEAAGPILRGPFANELATGQFLIEPARPFDEISLSARAVKPAASAAVRAAGELVPKKPTFRQQLRGPEALGRLNARKLGAADPSKSYIVLRLYGDTPKFERGGVVLSRLAADGTEIVYDGAATAAYLGFERPYRLGVGHARPSSSATSWSKRRPACGRWRPSRKPSSTPTFASALRRLS